MNNGSMLITLMSLLSLLATPLDASLGDRILEAITREDIATIRQFLATEEGQAVVHHYRDPTGATLLHRAIEQRNDEIVQLLINAHAPLDAKDNWRETPLHTAAERGYSEGVQLLTTAGAHLDALDNDDETPLHKAALRGHDQTARKLLDAGAEPDEQDNWKKTPLEHNLRGLITAEKDEEEQFRNVARLLVQKGALIADIDSLLETVGEEPLRNELRHIRNKQLESARQTLINTCGLSRDECSIILKLVSQKTPAMLE